MSPDHIATLITEDIRINNGMLDEAATWVEFWELMERARDLIGMINPINISDENYEIMKNKLIQLNIKIINLLPDKNNSVRKYLTDFNKELRLRWIPEKINTKRLEHALNIPPEYTAEFAAAQTAQVESTISIREIVRLYLDLKSTVRNFVDKVDIVSNRKLEVFILAIEKVIKALTILVTQSPLHPHPHPPIQKKEKGVQGPQKVMRSAPTRSLFR